MNILHISTSDRGGAAIAALRQHQALLQAGIDSKFLCLNKSGVDIPEVYPFQRPSYSLFLKGLHKLGVYHTQADKNQKDLNQLKGKYKMFTFPRTDFNVMEHPLVQKTDIINLHWVGNFLDWPSFFKGINKPVVWTLHDMNPFQGGFHYVEDKIRNAASFSSLENKLLEEKIRSLAGFKNLCIVAPSQWLVNESQKSTLFRDYPHRHIPYSLDLNIFKPFDQYFARKVFDLPQNKKILLFVSQSTSDRRKGLNLLAEAFKMIQNKEDVMVVAIGGKPKKSGLFQNVHFLGSIHGERLMRLAYAAADAFVIPSREDNLPNVMLEALACGTPVIGYPIGGVKETIRSGINGLVADEVSPLALNNAIMEFFQQTFDTNAIRKFAEEQFHPKVQAQKYMELYQSCLV